MKIILSSLLALICFGSIAQTNPIAANVYTWDNSTVTSSNKNTVTKKMFSGSGAILSLHELNGVILHKGKKINYKADPSGNEHFFIVKKGPLSVTLNGKEYLIDRGSVVFVLPGDALEISNKAEGDAEFYAMDFRAIAPANAERGKNAGASFVMNWNDMIAKPTDKGSTRQLFDRQTTMLNRFDIHVTQLNKGFNSHPPHTHKNEEIILMLDGNAEMSIDINHPKANGGDAVLLTSMIPHNLTNVGETPCLYFAIQWN